MVGVNIGVAAPMAFFPFGGVKDSIFGDLRCHGKDAVAFYTQQRVTISRWPYLRRDQTHPAAIKSTKT